MKSRIMSAIGWLAYYEKKLGVLDVEDRALQELRSMKAKADCVDVVEKCRIDLLATAHRGQRAEIRGRLGDLTKTRLEIEEAIGDIEYWVEIRNRRKVLTGSSTSS